MESSAFFLLIFSILLYVLTFYLNCLFFPYFIVLEIKKDVSGESPVSLRWAKSRIL